MHATSFAPVYALPKLIVALGPNFIRTNPSQKSPILSIVKLSSRMAKGIAHPVEIYDGLPELIL